MEPEYPHQHSRSSAAPTSTGGVLAMEKDESAKPLNDFPSIRKLQFMQRLQKQAQQRGGMDMGFVHPTP